MSGLETKVAVRGVCANLLGEGSLFMTLILGLLGGFLGRHIRSRCRSAPVYLLFLQHPQLLPRSTMPSKPATSRRLNY